MTVAEALEKFIAARNADIDAEIKANLVRKVFQTARLTLEDAILTQLGKQPPNVDDEPVEAICGNYLLRIPSTRVGHRPSLEVIELPRV